MPHPANDDTLVDRYYVTLILRLTLHRSGRLIQGELVDTAGILQKRFIGASGLDQALAAWRKQQKTAKGNTKSGKGVVKHNDTTSE
jgi:hypothetical protein